MARHNKHPAGLSTAGGRSGQPALVSLKVRTQDRAGVRRRADVRDRSLKARWPGRRGFGKNTWFRADRALPATARSARNDGRRRAGVKATSRCRAGRAGCPSRARAPPPRSSCPARNGPRRSTFFALVEAVWRRGAPASGACDRTNAAPPLSSARAALTPAPVAGEPGGTSAQGRVVCPTGLADLRPVTVVQGSPVSLTAKAVDGKAPARDGGRPSARGSRSREATRIGGGCPASPASHWRKSDVGQEAPAKIGGHLLNSRRRPPPAPGGSTTGRGRLQCALLSARPRALSSRALILVVINSRAFWGRGLRGKVAPGPVTWVAGPGPPSPTTPARLLIRQRTMRRRELRNFHRQIPRRRARSPFGNGGRGAAIGPDPDALPTQAARSRDRSVKDQIRTVGRLVREQHGFLAGRSRTRRFGN